MEFFFKGTSCSLCFPVLFYSLLRGPKLSKQKQQGETHTHTQHPHPHMHTHQPPALCTIWKIKKAAVIDQPKLCPCGTAECGFDFNQIYLRESEKAQNPVKIFFGLCCCSFCWPPQASLTRLIKRPLPAWLLSLCLTNWAVSTFQTTWPRRCWQTRHGFHPPDVPGLRSGWSRMVWMVMI